MSTWKLICDCLGESGRLLKELGKTKEKINTSSNKVIKNITSMNEEYYEVDRRMYDDGEEYFLLYYVPAGCDGKHRFAIGDYVQEINYKRIDGAWSPQYGGMEYKHFKYRNLKEVKRVLMQHKKGGINYRGKRIIHMVEIFHNDIQACIIKWIIVGQDKKFYSAEDAIEYIDNEMFSRNDGTPKDYECRVNDKREM